MRTISFLWGISGIFLSIQSLYATISAPRHNLYCVALAGGDGQRLWPLSRQKKPKQLLSLNSSKTLLQENLNRVRPLVQSNEQLWVVTTQQHEHSVRECLGDQVGTIVVEGATRNTGPAVLYTCMQIYKKDPNALVLFLPADSYIPHSEDEKVLNYLDTALSFVHKNKCISLFGMQPTRPETGFGYIEFNRNQTDLTPFYMVKKFHEKPNKITAEDYLTKGTFAWNITMFCAPVQVILSECQRVCPELVAQVQNVIAGVKDYAQIDSIAIEPALMERSHAIWVLPVSFEWYDVGNVGVFLSLNKALAVQKLVQVDAKNNIVDVSDKLVALVGVDDLCIVQTDDALLVTRRNDAEKVRHVVQYLKQNNLTTYI
jgi:mannose-1-phosphate guanylyltransferase